MTEPSSPRAGGAIVALCAVAGFAIGLVAGQPSLGILGGTALGAALAILVWLKDRRQNP